MCKCDATRSVSGKIRSKEYGGDQRQVTIDQVVINGEVASAKVTFAGTKMTFVSIIGLVKDDQGRWKLISDMPVVR
ncbi:MAG: nuclear transport factor 2 family protein [Cytophagales bacterium]|nr:nuclear transport factor 2 family protein [Cytophagales bacterium]